MDPRIIEGTWEEVTAKHANDLKGRRVEVRVLDSAKKTGRGNGSWAAFETRVGKLTRGWRVPGGHLYTAEDFYESKD